MIDRPDRRSDLPKKELLNAAEEMATMRECFDEFFARDFHTAPEGIREIAEIAYFDAWTTAMARYTIIALRRAQEVVDEQLGGGGDV